MEKKYGTITITQNREGYYSGVRNNRIVACFNEDGMIEGKIAERDWRVTSPRLYYENKYVIGSSLNDEEFFLVMISDGNIVNNYEDLRVTEQYFKGVGLQTFTKNENSDIYTCNMEIIGSHRIISISEHENGTLNISRDYGATIVYDDFDQSQITNFNNELSKAKTGVGLVSRPNPTITLQNQQLVDSVEWIRALLIKRNENQRKFKEAEAALNEVTEQLTSKVKQINL